MIGNNYDTDGQELGQSICEEEYNMDFKSYSDGELECEGKIARDNYDGIKIKLNEVNS